jgi:hypothetical protein
MMMTSSGERALFSPDGKDVRVRLSLGAYSGAVAVASDGSGYVFASFVAVENMLHVALVPVSGRGDMGESRRIGPFTEVTGIALSSGGADYLFVVSGRSFRVQRVAPTVHRRRLPVGCISAIHFPTDRT